MYGYRTVRCQPSGYRVIIVVIVGVSRVIERLSFIERLSCVIVNRVLSFILRYRLSCGYRLPNEVKCLFVFPCNRFAMREC